MDPLAHTLFGAAMAEAGLKKLSRYATATLLVGANLPDVDAVAMLWGEDISLYVRRGWSHGVLAMVVLPPFGYGTDGGASDEPMGHRCIGPGWWRSVFWQSGPIRCWIGSIPTVSGC